MAGSEKVTRGEGLPGWALDPGTRLQAVKTQISQGTDNSFLQAVRAQRNLIGHLLQPPLFVGKQVEAQRAEVTCSFMVTCQVSRKATRPLCLQSPPGSCCLESLRVLFIQSNSGPFYFDSVSTVRLRPQMLYTKPNPCKLKYVLSTK